MKSTNPLIFLLIVVILATGAVAALVTENLSWTGRTRRAAEFQHLVGGLGLGPTTDLTRCAFRFDPRLCPACPQDEGPVAGGSWFCPCQSCSILYFRPLRDRGLP